MTKDIFPANGFFVSLGIMLSATVVMCVQNVAEHLSLPLTEDILHRP